MAELSEDEAMMEAFVSGQDIHATTAAKVYKVEPDEVTREMSADWPAFDMLTAAGYCKCKPHPDDASCRADLPSTSGA